MAYRQRIERSEFVGEKQGWEQYWDPRFECNFFYNVMDGRLTCVDPVAGYAGGERRRRRAQDVGGDRSGTERASPEPEPMEPDGQMRALTAEEEKLGMTGPMLLKNEPASRRRGGTPRCHQR